MLGMIAGHYGLHPDIEVLRKACALGIDGVSLLGISKAAEEIGFHTIGGRLTLDSLITDAKLPCILHWKQNHFVVLYKVRRKKHHPIFYVADPGKACLSTVSESSRHIGSAPKAREKRKALHCF